jgi:tRNA threonylcarbamoyladenosine biosynthesis protein TsaB
MVQAPVLKLLAFDTASQACSAAALVGEQVVAHRFELITRGHAERLMPMIEAVMAEAGLDYRDLDGIAVTVGPGSFTGVRTGLAAARGLALAAGLRLVGISTLEALAAAVPDDERHSGRILAVLDAAHGQVYAQRFDSDGRPLAPLFAVAAAALADQLDRAWLVGSGSGLVRQALGAMAENARYSQAPAWPDAATIARHVASRAGCAGGLLGLTTETVAPLYVRAAGVRLPAGEWSGA